MSQISPELIVALALLILVSFPVHEFSHALASYRLGDGTAKLLGRLTLNPVAHFDPVGGVLLIFSALLSNGGYAFGWAKPTPYNPINIRSGHRGEAIIALAGPASNLILAAAASIPLRFIAQGGFVDPQLVPIANILLLFVQINIFLAIFNFIPVPPLDGYKVMLGFLDPRTAWQVRPVLEQYGIFVLLLLFVPFGASGSLGGQIIVPIANAIRSFLVGF